MKFFLKRDISHHLNKKKFDGTIDFPTFLQKFIRKVKGVSIQIQLFLNNEFQNRNVVVIVKLDHWDRKITLKRRIIKDFDDRSIDRR